jgi:hypothetical protein
MTSPKRKSKTTRGVFERAHLLILVRLRLAGRSLKPMLVKHITEHVIDKLTAAQRRRLAAGYDRAAVRAVFAHAQPFAA